MAKILTIYLHNLKAFFKIIKKWAYILKKLSEISKND